MVMQTVASRFSTHRPHRPPNRHHVWNRIRARVLTAQLDRALAEGAPSDASDALELRAQALARRSVADELAGRLRLVVREAEQEPRPSLRVHACREAVLTVEHELRLLASRLQAANPVAVSAVAKVHVLLTDGTGPLYYPRTNGSLRAAVRDATAALD
jgi:hypothetical protein